MCENWAFCGAQAVLLVSSKLDLHDTRVEGGSLILEWDCLGD